MDELQLVREFFGEQPPPDPDTVAAAKARMFVGGPAVGRRSARRHLPARPKALLRLGIPAVAVATAAVVAVVVVQGPPVREPAPRGGIGVFQLPGGAAVGGSAGSGRDILLTVARTAAMAAQPAPERYYVTWGTVGNFVRVGPPGNRYLVLEVVNRQYWAATNPHDASPDMSQALYVQAASPADEAAWRRDGSPRVWEHAGQELGLADPVAPGAWLGAPVTVFSGGQLSAAPGTLGAADASYGMQPFFVGDNALSLRQLQALPADPAKLKALLQAGGYKDISPTPEYHLFQEIPGVLEMPVTPAVRSALYKLLASLPGVRSLGTVTDVAGRQGIAVAYTAGYSGCGRQIAQLTSPLFSSCTIQQILIINPDDGMPLAEELRYTQLPAGQHWSAPDGLFSYEVFNAPYWTNHPRPKN